jgi:hypothetical protein
MILTVIIRDQSPFIHLQEPCSYRTVHIVLTEDQIKELIFRHSDECISHSFIEPTK